MSTSEKKTPGRKKTTKTPASEPQGPDFEAAMEELEDVVAKLEAGDVALEESLAAFERGVALVRVLHARLDAVERKIEELARRDDGSLAVTRLEEGDDA